MRGWKGRPRLRVDRRERETPTAPSVPPPLPSKRSLSLNLAPLHSGGFAIPGAGPLGLATLGRLAAEVLPALAAAARSARDAALARLLRRRPARDTFLSLAALAGAAWWAAGRSLATATARKVADVLAADADAADRASAIDLSRLDGLPEPAARYLRFALPAGGPRPRAVRVRQAGAFRFRIAPGLRSEDGWKPVVATQTLAAGREPGYVWAASIQLAPGLWATGWDAFSGGRGHMLWKLGGAVPLIDSGGGAASGGPPAPEVDQSALLRYLAEAVYAPAALLPGVGRVRWEAAGPDAARAVLAAGPGRPTVAATFHMRADGAVTAVTSADRARPLEDGTAVADEHTVTFGEWVTRSDGVSIPLRMDARWDLVTPFPYARLRVTGVSVWDTGPGGGWREV